MRFCRIFRWFSNYSINLQTETGHSRSTAVAEFVFHFYEKPSFPDGIFQKNQARLQLLQLECCQKCCHAGSVATSFSKHDCGICSPWGEGSPKEADVVSAALRSSEMQI